MAVMAVVSTPLAGTQLMTRAATAAADGLQGNVVPPKGALMDRVRVAAAENVELAASGNGPIALGAGPTRVVLSPPSTAAPLVQRIRTLAPSDQVYLVLQGIDTGVPPGVTYNVFLGPPDPAASAGPADPHYVGTLSFFDAGPSRNAVFNVTRKIKALSESGTLNDRPSVTVVPAGTPEGGAKPSITKVRLVAGEP
jgi:hypothetical protein